MFRKVPLRCSQSTPTSSAHEDFATAFLHLAIELPNQTSGVLDQLILRHVEDR
jgi:hypothetical protein